MSEKKAISIIQKSKEAYLEELLNAISEYESYSDLEKLYQFIDDITSKLWMIGKSFIVSTPRKKYRLGQFRMLWNKDVAQKWSQVAENKYKDLELEKIFEQSSQSNEGAKLFETMSGYHITKVGSEGDQEFWCFFPENEYIDDDLYDKLVGFIRRSFKIIKQWQEMSKLSTLIYTDDVTGLYNQRKLMLDLDECIRKHETYKEKFSVLFLDLDHFKLVNDGHGHMVGTRVLVNIAELLREVVRDTDMLYRYGGDEFVVILQNADVEISSVVGERVLQAFKSRKFELSKNKKYPLSASIGVATYPTHASTREAVLTLADNMMFEAKKDGRGQVRLATELFNKK